MMILAVIPGVNVVPILLTWIGGVCLLWSLVHGRYMWCQWRETGRPPGVFGGGLWAMFTGMATVCLVGITRILLPDMIVLRAISQAALLAVAVAVSWLFYKLLRLRR